MTTIPSVDWVRRYKLRLTHYQHLLKPFLKAKVTELINKIIVDSIVDEMRAHNVSRKIYETVVVKDVMVTDEGIKATIHSEYFAENGFDVALAREEGTEDHFIQPLRNAMQFDRLDPSIVENLPKALSWVQNGQRRFSKGHWVSGLPKLNIIENMIEKKEYELQEQLNIEFKKWKQNIFKDI